MAAAAASLPCLVFDHGDEHGTTTIYSVPDGTHRPGDDDLNELLRGNKRIWVTSHGWLLVWDPATLATYLWNPHARENNKIYLPSLAKPPADAEAWCVLSSKPTDPGGCTVLLADSTTNLMWYCRVGDPASSSWVRHEYNVGTFIIPAGYVGEGETEMVLYRPASWRGKFYYHRASDEIGVVDLSPATAGAPVFSVLPMKEVRLVPAGGCCLSLAASTYLLDLDGELYQVLIFSRNADFHTVADVGVYRLDFERKEAVMVDGIGDRAILVGSSSSFAGWCPATLFGLAPSSVYWTSPYDGCLHVYDIEHRAVEARETCGGGGASEPSSTTSFWMVPPQA